MTYHPNKGNDINFDLTTYNPPISTDIILNSQDKKSYYVVPNADEVSFSMKEYSPNSNFELAAKEDVIRESYQIPPGNTVNFELKDYVVDSSDFELITSEKPQPELSLQFEIKTEMDSKFDSHLVLQYKSRTEYFTKINFVLLNIKIEGRSTIVTPVLFPNELFLPFKANSEITTNLDTGLKINVKSEVSVDLKLNESIVIYYSAVSGLTADISQAFSIIFESTSLFSTLVTLNSLDEQLLILSPDLELVAYLEQYNDFVWHKRWRKVDNFEVSIRRETNEAKYLKLGNYVAKKRGDVIHAGRISSRDLKKDSNGEILTVSGKGLGEIFESRVAFNNVNIGDGYDSFVGAAENAMQHYVDTNVINPTDSERSVSRLQLELSKDRGTVIHYKARFQKISKILYEIAKTTGLGWDVQLDLESKKFVFKVLSAKIKKGVRLNPDFDSVKMINFKEINTENENTIMIAGQGEGADRMIKTISRNEV